MKPPLLANLVETHRSRELPWFYPSTVRVLSSRIEAETAFRAFKLQSDLKSSGFLAV